MSTTIGPTPKNQTWRKRNQSSTFPTGFPNVFITFFRIFSHFFKCIFKTHVFTFFQVHFQNAFFSHVQNTFFTFFPGACSNTFFHKNVKNCEKCEKMRFENAPGKNVKKYVLKMHLKKCAKKMWKKCVLKMQLEKMWKKCVLKMWKNAKNVKKCENAEKMGTKGNWKVPVSQLHFPFFF